VAGLFCSIDSTILFEINTFLCRPDINSIMNLCVFKLVDFLTYFLPLPYVSKIWIRHIWKQVYCNARRLQCMEAGIMPDGQNYIDFYINFCLIRVSTVFASLFYILCFLVFFMKYSWQSPLGMHCAKDLFERENSM
jgi:hypothetical protein